MEGRELTPRTAYKFLRPGAIGPFSGFAWPTPEAGKAGAWVEAAGDGGPCSDGIHACEPLHLPRWIWEELWVVELDGEVQAARHKLRAPRGRLVERVAAWDVASARSFARACAERAGELSGSAAAEDADVARVMRESAEEAAGAAQGTDDAHAAAKGAAVCAYIAAMIALRTGGEDLHGAERDRQAAELAEMLGISL